MAKDICLDFGSILLIHQKQNQHRMYFLKFLPQNHVSLFLKNVRNHWNPFKISKFPNADPFLMFSLLGNNCILS